MEVSGVATSSALSHSVAKYVPHGTQGAADQGSIISPGSEQICDAALLQLFSWKVYAPSTLLESEPVSPL